MGLERVCNSRQDGYLGQPNVGPLPLASVSPSIQRQKPANANESKLMARMEREECRRGFPGMSQPLPLWLNSVRVSCAGNLPGSRSADTSSWQAFASLQKFKDSKGEPPQKQGVSALGHQRQLVPPLWRPESLVPATARWPERADLQLHATRLR